MNTLVKLVIRMLESIIIRFGYYDGFIQVQYPPHSQPIFENDGVLYVKDHIAYRDVSEAIEAYGVLGLDSKTVRPRSIYVIYEPTEVEE